MAGSRKQRGERPTPTPHDLVFKQFLTHPGTAREFMALHLPAELYALCDFSTLRLESGSFVEERLRAYFSDVLYSLKTIDGKDGYIHVLIEHQSAPDRQMAFRLMRYAIAAMNRHLDAGHKKLPLVIPVLFYNGRRSPYPCSTRWLDGFALPGVAEKLYSGEFPLVDVTVIPDEEIMNHRSMAALTLLQKYIHRRNLADHLDRLAALLLKKYLTEQQLVSLINYLVQAGKVINPEVFIRELAHRVPQYEDTLMTIAQQLEQKGIEKGIAKGIEQGGREATFKIAQAMLENGLDRAIVMKITGLSEADIVRLAG